MSVFCNFHLYGTNIDDCILCKIIVFAVDPNIYLSTAITTMQYKISMDLIMVDVWILQNILDTILSRHM